MFSFGQVSGLEVSSRFSVLSLRSLLAVGAASTRANGMGPNGKRVREWIRTLFFYYFYYINSWGGTRQSFGLYFRILFIELAGKSGKWGLDKICAGGCAAGCALRARSGSSCAAVKAWGSARQGSLVARVVAWLPLRIVARCYA